MCKALRDHGVTADIDVHLMVDPVDRIIGDFIDAGASYITFHPEASNHIDRSLSLIRAGGCKAGLVFTPATVSLALPHTPPPLPLLPPFHHALYALFSILAPWAASLPIPYTLYPKPQTHVQSLDYCKYVMDKIDIILLMSVNPGFGGQKFIPSTLEKAKEARKMIDASVSTAPPKTPVWALVW